MKGGKAVNRTEFGRERYVVKRETSKNREQQIGKRGINIYQKISNEEKMSSTQIRSKISKK